MYIYKDIIKIKCKTPKSGKKKKKTVIEGIYIIWINYFFWEIFKKKLNLSKFLEN